jgi:hypothetical protein
MRSTTAQRRAQDFAEFKRQQEQERRDQVIAEFDGDPQALAAENLRCTIAWRAQEPVSPSLARSLMSASALPTPARFRRLGPPMFDFPRIAS